MTDTNDSVALDLAELALALQGQNVDALRGLIKTVLGSYEQTFEFVALIADILGGHVALLHHAIDTGELADPGGHVDGMLAESETILLRWATYIAGTRNMLTTVRGALR